MIDFRLQATVRVQYQKAGIDPGDFFTLEDGVNLGDYMEVIFNEPAYPIDEIDTPGGKIPVVAFPCVIRHSLIHDGTDLVEARYLSATRNQFRTLQCGTSLGHLVRLTSKRLVTGRWEWYKLEADRPQWEPHHVDRNTDS